MKEAKEYIINKLNKFEIVYEIYDDFFNNKSFYIYLKNTHVGCFMQYASSINTIHIFTSEFYMEWINKYSLSMNLVKKIISEYMSDSFDITTYIVDSQFKIK